MNPIETRQTNLTFHLMGNSDSDLPVEQIWEDGRTINISTWELSFEERRALLTGALIELWVWGNNHPPVGLQIKGRNATQETKGTSESVSKDV